MYQFAPPHGRIRASQRENAKREPPRGARSVMRVVQAARDNPLVSVSAAVLATGLAAEMLRRSKLAPAQQQGVAGVASLRPPATGSGDPARAHAAPAHDGAPNPQHAGAVVPVAPAQAAAWDALYTEVNAPECAEVFHNAKDGEHAMLQLYANNPDQSRADRIVKAFTEVTRAGPFERALCPAAVDGIVQSLNGLMDALDVIVVQHPGSAITIARAYENVQNLDEPFQEVGEAIRARLLQAIRAQITVSADPRPAGSILRQAVNWMSSMREREPTALELRQYEVLYKLLCPPTELISDGLQESHVRRTRAKTWEEIKKNGKGLDMRFFGARYRKLDGVPFGYDAIQYLPDEIPRDSSNRTSLSAAYDWGLAAAIQAATAAYETAIDERSRRAVSGLKAGYKVEQHTGFEQPGVGYALYVALDVANKLSALGLTHKFAATAAWSYVRRLLDVADQASPSAVEWVQLESQQSPSDLKYAACKMQDRSEIREEFRSVCSGYDRDKAARDSIERIRALVGDPESCTVDAIFDRHDDLDALFGDSDSARELCENLRGIVGRLRRPPKAKGQRRLEVVKKKLGIAYPADSAAARIYQHIAQKAVNNEPHKLDVYELGTLHTVTEVHHKVLFRTPQLREAKRSGVLSSMRHLGVSAITSLLPPSFMATVNWASELKKSVERQVEYVGHESAGVGYALVSALAILDHACSMINTEPGSGYGFVKQATLEYVRELLRQPADAAGPRAPAA
jgi:hypothetical protein